jgi:hypothetical protein
MSIPMIKVPSYVMKLPYTQQEVKYRPYVVREEKMLIMANESEDMKVLMDALGDVIKSCTYDVVDINTAPLFDVQYAFLQIRGKSIGENLEFNCICGECDARMPVNITVNDFVLKHTPGHSNKIQLDNNFHVTMRYPTFQHYTKLYMDESNEEYVYDILAECIESIYTEDEVFVNTGNNNQDFREFVENLTVPQFEKLENFFVTMPILEKIINYDCPECNRTNIISIDGITNFFG